jgi:hypothetical protein
MSEQYPIIDYLLTVYRESSAEDLGLLDLVIEGMCHQDYPNLNFIVIIDRTTPRGLLDWITDTFKRFTDKPIQFYQRKPTASDQSANMEGMLEYMYHKSTAEYIATNHSDDPPYSWRISTQINSFKENPMAVLSMAGNCYYNSKGRSVQIHKPYFHRQGLTGGNQSGWMFQRSKLLSIPEVQFRDPEGDGYIPIEIGPCIDTAIFCYWLTYLPIIAIQYPCYQYTMYHSFHYPNEYKTAFPAYFKYVDQHYLDFHMIIMYNPEGSIPPTQHAFLKAQHRWIQRTQHILRHVKYDENNPFFRLQCHLHEFQYRHWTNPLRVSWYNDIPAVNVSRLHQWKRLFQLCFYKHFSKTVPIPLCPICGQPMNYFLKADVAGCRVPGDTIKYISFEEFYGGNQK